MLLDWLSNYCAEKDISMLMLSCSGRYSGLPENKHFIAVMGTWTAVFLYDQG